MTLKGGLTGVHQVRFWWNDHSGLEIEEADFVHRQPEKLTQNRIDAIKRSELIKAFYANAPDVRNCTSNKKRKTVLDQFLKSKRWKRIYDEVMK